MVDKDSTGFFAVFSEIRLTGLGRCASRCPFVAALLRVGPQFRLVFTEMLRMLRVGRGEGGYPYIHTPSLQSRLIQPGSASPPPIRLGSIGVCRKCCFHCQCPYTDY
jgi:hypothetical protein